MRRDPLQRHARLDADGERIAPRAVRQLRVVDRVDRRTDADHVRAGRGRRRRGHRLCRAGKRASDDRHRLAGLATGHRAEQAHGLAVDHDRAVGVHRDRPACRRGHDRRRHRRSGARAGRVLGRHDDPQRVALVDRDERVRLARRTGDAGAVGAVLVTAPPLVGKGQRRCPAPGAVGGRQSLADAGAPGDGRRRRVHRRIARRRLDHSGRVRRGAARALRIGGGDPYAQRVADVHRRCRVRLALGVVDVRAAAADVVTATPLVRIGDGRRAAPRAVVGCEHLPPLGRTGDGRRRCIAWYRGRRCPRTGKRADEDGEDDCEPLEPHSRHS